MIAICLINLLLFSSIFTVAEEKPTNYLSNINKKSCMSRIITNLFHEGVMDKSDNFWPFESSLDKTEGRGKKKVKLGKYLVPLLIGFLIIKSILLPIALKTLALLSGKAVLMSLMSLILASIVGLKKIAHSEKNVDIVTVPLSKYRRKDLLYDWDEHENDDPYSYHRDVERTHRIRKDDGSHSD